MSTSQTFAFIAFIASAAACSGGSNVTGTGGGGGGGCSGTNANVAVCDNHYSPANSTITAGSSITWTWKGTNQHSVTFTSGSLNGMGSATQAAGSFVQTFNTPGTYTYECVVHGAAMSGSVTVN